MGGCDLPPGPIVELPPSSTCSEGPVPQGCVTIPPMQAPPARTIDGAAGPSEQWGTVELPVANVASRAAGGHVRVALDDPPPSEARSLYLFLEDVPVDVNANELAVFLDLDRFVRGRDGLDPAADRAFVFDLRSGAFEVRAPRYLFGARSWAPAPPLAGAEGALGACEDDTGQLGPIRRCDAELRIGLPPDRTRPPSDLELPGVGLAVADDTFAAALPEELAAGVPEGRERAFLRRAQLTLLFGRPAAIPLRFSTWNARRFGEMEQCLLGDPFAAVDLAEQAALIADHDVVALQEVWTQKAAERLLEAVNALRPADAPMTLIGPVDRNADFKNLCREYLELYASGVATLACGAQLGLQESQGGLWILSRYPPIAQDYLVFDDCRGEDCYKAKGVQWARLWLRPPTEENTDPDCLAALPGAACPAGPSSALYVDVFNTHLQASSPTLCTDDELLFALRLIVEGAMCGPLLAFMSADFNCLGYSGDAATRVRQLEAMAAFVERVTADSQGQLAIVAGDFNIDGRDVRMGDRRNGFGYARILGELGIGYGGAPDVEVEPDDRIGPWPDAFDWDVDHGDVARETGRAWAAEPCVGPACSLGTSIHDAETSRGPVVAPGDPARCDDDGDARLDYILLRPRRPPDASPPATPPYLVTRAGRREDVWQAVWPAPRDMPLACETPPQLLSDHRVVTADLQVVPLRAPPRYHPAWDHDVELRVSSYDLTGETDCFLDVCGPVDAVARLSGARVLSSGAAEPVPGTPRRTAECEGWAGSWADDACMSGWAVSDRHVAAAHVGFSASVRLLDADSTSGDDYFDVMQPGRSPQMSIWWPTGEVTVSQEGDTAITPAGWRDFQVFNADPVPFCTRGGRPKEVCLALRFEEAP